MLFRLSAAFVDCLEQNPLPEGWFEESAPAGTTHADLARLWRAGSPAFKHFFTQAKAEIYANEANTYHGLTSVHCRLSAPRGMQGSICVRCG